MLVQSGRSSTPAQPRAAASAGKGPDLYRGGHKGSARQQHAGDVYDSSGGQRSTGHQPDHRSLTDWPSPITNEVAGLLLVITAGGTLVLLALLYTAWAHGQTALASTLQSALAMITATALAAMNFGLRRRAKMRPAEDAASLERRYRRLEWLEWGTILLGTTLILVALNGALPAVSRVLVSGG